MAREELTFPEIKRELLEKIDRIEKYIEDGNKSREELRLLVLKIHKKIYGDDEANPPIVGQEDRIKKLEVVEEGRLKSKEIMLKMAIGSVTIAVGTMVLWMFGALRDAFVKGH